MIPEEIIDFLNNYYNCDITNETERTYSRYKLFYYYLGIKYLPTYSLSLLSKKVEQSHCMSLHQIRKFHEWIKIYPSIRVEIEDLEYNFRAKFPKVVMKYKDLDDLETFKVKRQLKIFRSKIESQRNRINYLESKFERMENIFKTK